MEEVLKYSPLMSKNEILRRKNWGEASYAKLRSITKLEELEILGKKIIALPGMFIPLWGDSSILAKNVQKEVKDKDVVLDLGTGTGIQGIFAASKSNNITSVDINSEAIKCAKLNVQKSGLTNKIKVLESDLFSNIRGKFSLIIFNPPFGWFKPRDMLERSDLDENYQTLQRFFKEVRDHLEENGRILLVFSDFGDVKFLEGLINKNNFNFKIIDKERYENKEVSDWFHIVYKIF